MISSFISSFAGRMTMENVLLAWSGGKDSAIALFEIAKNPGYRISALLTTVTGDFDRISMHGVRRVLLHQQAESMGLPLEEVIISKNSSNQEYESAMAKVLTRYKQEGVESVVFGDIFLEDLRTYRESNLAKIGMKGIFPLWKKDTGELAESFLQSGFKAITTCVDTTMLDSRFVGREMDRRFFSELPGTVDPCGENGEYHSFVHEGPIFRQKIPYTTGDVVLRENRFCYCDLLPG
jgi:uncharacterized protein (TIGR00290 family)